MTEDSSPVLLRIRCMVDDAHSHILVKVCSWHRCGISIGRKVECSQELVNSMRDTWSRAMLPLGKMSSLMLHASHSVHCCTCSYSL